MDLDLLRRIFQVWAQEAKFDQSDWMKVYIEKNTKLRQEAKNDFEKDFFKVLCISIIRFYSA